MQSLLGSVYFPSYVANSLFGRILNRTVLNFGLPKRPKRLENPRLVIVIFAIHGKKRLITSLKAVDLLICHFFSYLSRVFFTT